MKLDAFLSRNKVTAPVYEDTTYPLPWEILKARELCPANRTKVIILGHDPYPTPDWSDGLAYSVKPGCPIPPTLRNVLRECRADVGIETPTTGDLSPWALQGVLLLNRVLTVEKGKPGSHAGLGWERVTAQFIQDVLDWNRPLVIMAWGALAQEGATSAEINEHTLLLTGGHPSPMNRSVPFRGGRYFSRANEWLKAHGVAPIDWRLK